MQRILLLFLLVGSINAQDWTNQQKTLFTSYAIGSIIDAAQTNFAMRNTNCREVNGLYGKEPPMIKIVLYKSVSSVLLYWLSDKLPNKERTVLLYGLNVLQWGVVINNYQYIGVKLDFTF